MKKFLADFVEEISDDIQSTFMAVGPHLLVNMLQGEHEFPVVLAIVQKYIKCELEFVKTNQFDGDYDVYNIKVKRYECPSS